MSPSFTVKHHVHNVFGLDAGEFVPLNAAPDLSFNQAQIDKALKRLADAVLSDLS